MQDVVDLNSPRRTLTHPNKMEEQKETLPASTNQLGADSVATINRSAAARDDRRRLLINSLVLLVTIPALLRCSGGGDLPHVAWNLSLFAVAYLFCCTCSFSATDTPLAKISATLFYVGLLALFARSFLSKVLGMVIMYLDSIIAAGHFGAVLAQHRHRNGTETASLVAVANAGVRKREDRRENRRGAYTLIGLMAFCCVPHLTWFIVVDGDAFDVAANFFIAVSFVQLIHTSCVVGWLNGAVFDDAFLDDAVPIILYFLFEFWIFIVSYTLMGEIVAVTVYWLCILASTAFLGYCQQIHTSYEEILSMRELATEVPPLEEILVV